MPDEPPDSSEKAIDNSDLEASLLLALELSDKALDETFAKLKEIEDKVFDIVNKELDEIDEATGKSKMPAFRAALIFHKLNESVLKKHKSRLETIQVLHGIRKDGDSELGDDLIDGSDTDLSDSERKGAMKALAAFLKNKNHHRVKTYKRKTTKPDSTTK